MKKKIIFLFLIAFTCVRFIHAQHVNNFITYMNDLPDAYADVDLVSEDASHSSELDADWCQYLTNSDVLLGTRAAVLLKILNNSANKRWDEEYEEEPRYRGEKNFNVFNAYILNKYKLGKINYDKVSVDDALLHILVSQGINTMNTNRAKADTTYMNDLALREPKSLAVTSFAFLLKCYYFDGRRSHHKPFYRMAERIENSYDQYTNDIRPSAIQKMLDRITENDPCKRGSIVETENMLCNCKDDAEGVLYPFAQRIQCVYENQEKILKDMGARWDYFADKTDSDYWSRYDEDKWNTFKESVLVWIEAELKYIATLNFESIQETEARQLLYRQLALQRASRWGYLNGMGSGGVAMYPKFIKERNPKAFEGENAKYVADNENDANVAQMTFYFAEIDKILNTMYKDMGSATNQILRDAQRAWLDVYTARHKFTLDEKESRTPTNLKHRVVHLDMMMYRIYMWEAYQLAEKEILKPKSQVIFYDDVNLYKMLRYE